MDAKWLHLGCGQRVLPGATHIDLADFPHIEFAHDFRSLPMLDASSCDGIYASHCFEYIDPSEVPTVLADWKRVLKPGGILRLAVPDFAALCALYMETKNISLVLGPIYGRWKPHSGKSAARVQEMNDGIFHKVAYDEASLSEVLLTADFKNPRLWDWRKVFSGAWDGFDDYSQSYYPHMDKEHGRLLSLNMEATA